MAARIKCHDRPGVAYEFVTSAGGDHPTVQQRRAVYHDGTYRGDIVYVARRRPAPAGLASSTGFVTHYGWRPDGWRYSNNAGLSFLAEAIDRLRTVAGREEVAG